MKDPAAWSPRGLTELERRLLDAARADRIPPELSARIASSLPLQPSAADSVAQPSAAGAQALPLETLLFSKAKLWGSLSVALLACAGGWFALRSHGDALERQHTAPPTDTSSVIARAPDPGAPLPGATNTHGGQAPGASSGAASPSIDHSAAELTPADLASPNSHDPASPSRGELATPRRLDLPSPNAREPATSSRDEPAASSRLEQATRSRGDSGLPRSRELAASSRGDLAAPSGRDPASPSRGEQAAPVVTKPTRAATPSLQEELLLLDHARSALRAGEAQRALSLLDSHARRFTPGALGPEADAMRVEALVATGAHARADLLGRRFLQGHPTHPLAEHVAKLIARP